MLFRSRLHPLIILNPEKPIPPHLAKKFASCFSPGVVKIGSNNEVSLCYFSLIRYSQLMGAQVSIDERGMRNDSVSREVLRHEEFAGCVELKRIRDWFICKLPPSYCRSVEYKTDCLSPVSVESEGPYEPERLLPEAIKVMREKIASIRAAAEALLTGDNEGGDIPPSRKIDGEDVEMVDS